MSIRELLWAKFWVGTLPLLLHALGIVGTTDYLLQVTPFMFGVSIGSITLLTLAIAGLAIGFGTMFPQFDTENAAQIPTSFGGLLFMMTSIALIGGVIILEARPVYSYLGAQMNGQAADPAAMLVGFGLSGGLCIVATLLPVEVALRHLERVER
jgi:ABC-2 type transport system permease protein